MQLSGNGLSKHAEAQHLAKPTKAGELPLQLRVLTALEEHSNLDPSTTPGTIPASTGTGTQAQRYTYIHRIKNKSEQITQTGERYSSFIEWLPRKPKVPCPTSITK